MNFSHETRMFTETNKEPGTSTHSCSDDEDGDQSFQDSESKLSFDIMQTKIMDTTKIFFLLLPQ